MERGRFTHFSLSEINEAAQIAKGVSKIEALLDQAHVDGLVDRVELAPNGPEDAEFRYRLTVRGLDAVDEYFEEPEVSVFFSDTDRYLDLEAAQFGHNSGAILDLSSRGEEVDQVSAKIEKAYDVIKGDNQIDPEIRDVVLPTISNGLEILKRPKVIVGAVAGALLYPLYSAAQAVMTSEAQAAIQGAIDALKALIGI